MGSTSRVFGMVLALLGAATMLLTNIAYSLLDLLRPDVTVAGVTGGRFWWGMALTLLAFVGAMLAPFEWLWSVALLLVATIGFFFIATGWALIPAVLLVIAAGLIFLGRDHVPAGALHREPAM